MQNSTPMEEQELTINMYPKNVMSRVEVYSSIPHMNKRFRKMAKDHPEQIEITKDNGNDLFCFLDRGCVKISPRRVMSEEQKQASAKRLAEARVKKEAAE